MSELSGSRSQPASGLQFRVTSLGMCALGCHIPYACMYVCIHSIDGSVGVRVCKHICLPSPGLLSGSTVYLPGCVAEEESRRLHTPAAYNWHWVQTHKNIGCAADGLLFTESDARSMNEWARMERVIFGRVRD